MDENIGWELYRTLLAVLEEGSLSAAARALGITQPTAGRHVAALEAAFGQPLFTRSQQGLQATAFALTLQAPARAMRHTALVLERAASGAAAVIAGTVRVSASEIIATQVLPAALAPLRQRHPRLQIELVASNRLQDLLQREADIAVRMAAPAQVQLLATRAGRLEVGLYAHADYLRRRGVPERLEELAEHDLIGFDRATPFLRGLLQGLPGLARGDFAMRADSDVVQWALLRAGAGIGAGQVALARREPALVRVLPRQVRWRLEAWVTMHEDLRRHAACKCVFQALVDCMRAHAASP